MNAGGEHSDNTIQQDNDTNSDNNNKNNEVSFGETNNNNIEQTGGSSLPVEITDNSKIDFNKLVIKKV